MANIALAVVEAALRARKLDRTIAFGRGEACLASTDACPAPTDIPGLDTVLCGGVPRGQLSEIVGPRSSGRTTLLLQSLAAATARGEVAALVDTFDCLDVNSVAAAGVDLDRLLWIRGHAMSGPQASGLGLQDRIIERALKALNLVLQAGGFGLVAIDLADAPLAALRRLPFATWLRIQRTIEGSETACVITAPQPLARSAGGVTLLLAGQAHWHPEASFLAGLDVTSRVIAPRRWTDAEVAIGAQVR